MEETYSDEDSDDEHDSSEEEEEETKDDGKDKKQKVDRINSLKPFVDLEQYTLKVSDM